MKTKIWHYVDIYTECMCIFTAEFHLSVVRNKQVFTDRRKYVLPSLNFQRCKLSTCLNSHDYNTENLHVAQTEYEKLPECYSSDATEGLSEGGQEQHRGSLWLATSSLLV